MRHEEAAAAIATVRAWFGGLSAGEHVDGQVAHLIATILESKQLADWLDDTAVSAAVIRRRRAWRCSGRL